MILVGTSLVGANLQEVKSVHADDETQQLRELFQARCADCHAAEDDSEGGVDLARLQSDQDFLAEPKLLGKLVTVLSDRTMPPEGEEPLSDDQNKIAIGGLKSILAKSIAQQPFLSTPIRRMNRFQYNNAVVDLLGLDRDIFQMNERLMRRRSDYFNPANRKMPDQVRVSSRPLSKDIDNQRPEGFRGVSAFPQDKRAENGFDNRGDHLTLSPLLMESFLKLSQTIAESPDLNAKECQNWDRIFSLPGKPARSPHTGMYEAELAAVVRVKSTTQGSTQAQKLGPNKTTKWSRDTHLLWKCPQQNQKLTLAWDASQAGNGLRIALTTARDYGTFEVLLDGEKLGKPIDLFEPRIGRKLVEFKDIKVESGMHEITFHCVGKNGKSTGFFFGIDFLKVMGTPPTQPSASPSVELVIEQRLKWLLRRAFRRPVDQDTLDRFSTFAVQQLKNGASLEDTMRTVVGAVIGMPDFLYIYERMSNENSKPTQESNPLRVRVNDYELASRLSQFFWSSIPDDQLLDLAEAGELSKPNVLAAQIDRMMNDRKSSRFCDNFPAQWLQLERLITSIPDKAKYPYFYLAGYRTSMHMMSEPLLLFETVFVEDRSVIDLVNPDFSWQSDMLRQNYLGNSKAGSSVQVQLFKRVPIDNPRRGGVITNAAVMTMTSTPTRTQPITRGAWINTVIFNDPPEPPPADVPPLPESDKAELEKLTIRERLAVHRKRADCAGCHNKIDPLGFALENFGPTGVWRDKYENGRKVNPEGVLFNQYKFSSLEEFKQIIVKEKPRFIRAFAAHLLSYALGRELGPADWPALDSITQKAMKGEDSLRSIMKNIATSEPFLHKK